MKLIQAKTVIAVLLSPVLLLVACQSAFNSNIKFNKRQWDSVGDLESYPYRKDMLSDLITNHQIKDLTYHQVIDSLGSPGNYSDKKDSIIYNITTEYGYLDPKSGEYLAIGFNKDSIATGFKVVDWKNRHANE